MVEIDLKMLEKRGVNPYQATIMAARVARETNQKILQNIIQSDESPVVVALKKLMDGRVVMAEEEEIEA